MLVVGIDTKYAASGGTLNAALTPDLLDAGSIGIYTVDKVTGLFKLVTNAASGTGLLPATSVLPSETLKIVQGLGNGSFYQSDKHDVSGIKSITGSVYNAGTGQIIYIGYNPITGTGDINFDPQVSPPQPPYNQFSNIYRREIAIKVRKRLRGNNEYDAAVYFEVALSTADTKLSMLTNLIAQANTYQDEAIAGFPFVATLVGNILSAPVATTTSTATTGGAGTAGTYYYKIEAFNAAGVSLGSNEVSQVVPSGTSTNTVTVNWVAVTGATGYRVRRGTSSGNQTVYYTVGAVTTYADTFAASTAGTVNTSTAIGVKLVIADITATYEASVFGGLENATISYVGAVVGSGTPKQLQAIEADSNVYRGDLYTMSTIEKKLPKTVDTTKTYDVYRIESYNQSNDKTGTGQPMSQRIVTYAAFVVQGNVPSTNQQADFEDILTSIFSATSQIS